MSTVAEHLDAWEQAGLIDGVTADRLRAADPAIPDQAVAAPLGEPQTGGPPRRASTVFGPPATVPEVSGYLGTAFLLGAWFAWIGTQATHADDPSWVIGIGAAVASVGLMLVGAVLHLGDDRQRRAAGVAFLAALASFGTAAYTLISGAGVASTDVAVIASAVTLAVSVSFRAFHPAVLTEIGLLSAITSFAGTALAWFELTVFPSRVVFDANVPSSTGPDPIVLVVGSAAWWLSLAVVIRLLALVDATAAERSGDAAAGRRAGVGRFWAGMVAVVGLASAVSRSDFGSDGEYGRVLAPWMGDLGLLAVVAVLIERAFRRGSSADVYAAALGLVIALSDFNISYVTGGIEPALLVEGLILLGAGVLAERLGRRIRRPDAMPAAAHAAAAPGEAPPEQETEEVQPPPAEL